MHIHKWSKWKANAHYRDVSFGGPGIACTELVKMCKKCKSIKTKDVCARVPLDDEFEW